MGQGSISRRRFLKSATLSIGVLATNTLGQNSSQLTNTNLNKSTSEYNRKLLNGWQFHCGSLGGIWDVWRNDESAIEWESVQLPHCYNALDAVDPDRSYYEGQAWYRIRLNTNNPFKNGRTILHFEGAGQKSKIYLFLDEVAHHNGGYDEFTIDITENALRMPAIRGEGLPVAVLCDNSRDLETIPSDLNDFPRYGGLYRCVRVCYVPAISLKFVHLHVEMESNATAKLAVGVTLYIPQRNTDDLQLQIRIVDPEGFVVRDLSLTTKPWQGEQSILSITLDSPKLWSPANPLLYRCEVTLTSAFGSVGITEKFGCRYFEFTDNGPFKLNGERLLLKGTHLEEDHARVGSAIPSEVLIDEITMIKKMGANFIRLGHHQQSRKTLQLCDELGLLVWEEVPWSRGGLGGDEYKQEAREMLSAMIEQHYNHPSIIIWGLGNELDWPGDFQKFDKVKIRNFAVELNTLAHGLDPDRKTAIRRCSFCSDVPDIYSPSIWAGWYQGRYTQYKEISELEMRKVHHFLQMEWGGESHTGRHSEEPDRLLVKALTGKFKNSAERDYLLACGQNDAYQRGDWSETYVCNLFDWHLKEQETMPWLAGTAQWIFKDFATPLRPDNPIPHVNEKGLVDRNLNVKEGYFVFQSYWAEEPIIHIYGHSWPIRWGDEQEDKLVKVYSNCDEVELFLNGVSCDVKTRNSQNFPAAGLHWLVKFQSGDNSLRAVGQKNGTTVVDELRFQYQIEKWQHPAKLELREIARSNGIATVEARVYDANNVLCLDARNQVRFEVAGDGILLDNTGTVTGSRVVELSNGRAGISIQLKGNQSAVSVSSEKLETAILELS